MIQIELKLLYFDDVFHPLPSYFPDPSFNPSSSYHKVPFPPRLPMSSSSAPPYSCRVAVVVLVLLSANVWVS